MRGSLNHFLGKTQWISVLVVGVLALAVGSPCLSLAAVEFESFHVQKHNLQPQRGKSANPTSLQGAIRLAPVSNGINLEKEPLVVTLRDNNGTILFSQTIPAGALTKKKKRKQLRSLTGVTLQN